MFLPSRFLCLCHFLTRFLSLALCHSQSTSLLLYSTLFLSLSIPLYHSPPLSLSTPLSIASYFSLPLQLSSSPQPFLSSSVSLPPLSSSLSCTPIFNLSLSSSLSFYPSVYILLYICVSVSFSFYLPLPFSPLLLLPLPLSRQLFSWVGERSRLQVMVFAFLSVMAVQGVANLQAQWGIMGEFSNMPQEELLDWIQGNTKPGGYCSVFGFVVGLWKIRLCSGYTAKDKLYYILYILAPSLSITHSAPALYL